MHYFNSSNRYYILLLILAAKIGNNFQTCKKFASFLSITENKPRFFLNAIIDLTAIISHLTGYSPEGFSVAAANMNGDGYVTHADVVAVARLIVAR